MKRQVSTHRQPWVRTAIYSFMTLTVIVIVSLLMLVVLGYKFNEKDGKLEQGGLLQFESIPSGAAVSINGLRLGSLTSTKSTVESGNHFVEYTLTDYRAWQKSFKISPGQIGWLNYARLIPKTIEPQTVHEYTDLAGASASPNRKYILLHETAGSPDFTLANIQGDTLRYQVLALPDIYTLPTEDKPQAFTIDSWSNDDNAILIRHTYDDDKTEWLLLDRNSPEKSININTTYGIEPSKVQFAGDGNKRLFVRTDDIVRRINLDEQTLSRPLATNVDTYSVFDEKTIIYTTTASEGSRTVAYAAVDIASPVLLGSYPADDVPLRAAMLSYFNKRYVAVVHGQSLVVTYGALPTLTGKGAMKPFASRTVSEGVIDLVTGFSKRFFVMQLPDGYATYDIELKKYDKTAWAVQSDAVQPIKWLDEYMLWSDRGGMLRFYEFDGANQQNIMPVVEGFDVSLSQNNRYIYGVAKTDDGFALQRARLILR